MTERLVAETKDQETKVARPRAAYRPPSLVFYGAVATLTQNATGCDNNDNSACTGVLGRQNPHPPKTSDRRLKEHVERVGTHPMGFGLYFFEYKQGHREQSGHGRQFGVMADEVELVLPEAVGLRADGFKTVNYDMLGIRHPQ
jgi:hypothetical protein